MLAPLQRKVTSTEGEKKCKNGNAQETYRRPVLATLRRGLTLPEDKKWWGGGQKPLSRLPSSVP